MQIITVVDIVCPIFNLIGCNNGFYYHQYDNSHKSITFPKLRHLFLNNCDTRYLFNHSTAPYFPCISKLYLNKITFDNEAIHQINHTYPDIKVVHYTCTCSYNTPKYRRYAELYPQCKLSEMSEEDFHNIFDSYNDILEIDE